MLPAPWRPTLGDMTGPLVTQTPMPATAFAPLRLGVHLLIAASIGIVSAFTALAWPFAILVGMILGSSTARRLRGEHEGFADTFVTAILAAMGIIAMLIFGAIIGGVIAFAVVALASFSERVAAYASSTDRGIARLLVFIVPLAMWLFLFPLLGMDVDIRIGG
jgi:hypothetical protein